MRVAITGGTGYVGTHLRAALEARGDDVLVVERGRAGEPGVMWDPSSGWVENGLLDGYDAAVHLSGASIGAWPWTAKRRAVLRSSRIDTARLLVRHLRTLERGPRVLVSASAVGYYGNAGDAELTEASPKGRGFLADLVADWEAEGRRASEFGVRVVHTRFAPIVGRDSELMRRLVLPFRLFAGGPLGSGRQWFPWASVDDVVRVQLRALDDESLSGPVNVAGPDAVTNLEFARTLGRVLHRPAAVRVPAFALRLAFGRGLADEAVLADQRVVPVRLLEAGYDFVHPTVEAALAAHFGAGSR